MVLEEKPISFLKENLISTEFDKKLSKIKEQQAKNLLSILFVSFVVFSCVDSTSKKPVEKIRSNYEKLVQYCKEKNHPVNHYKTIIVINEIGTCINCNNIFSKGQGENLNSDSILFIVSGVGNKVDLSAYVDQKSPNLIYDVSSGFDELNIVKSCAIISLHPNEIDTIEQINVNNVYRLAEREL